MRGRANIEGKDLLIALALVGAGYLAYKILKNMLDEAEKQRK